MKQHTEDYKLTVVKYYLDHNEDMRDTCDIFKESPNTYEDIYNVISNILEKKITKEHLTNYLKHSYKIYKS
jgi:hypothetical protein